MSWFAQTDEAQEHIKKCKGCENCIWIEESAHAMMEYGTITEKEHSLKELIIDKFQGIEIE